MGKKVCLFVQFYQLCKEGIFLKYLVGLTTNFYCLLIMIVCVLAEYILSSTRAAYKQVILTEGEADTILCLEMREISQH